MDRLPTKEDNRFLPPLADYAAGFSKQLTCDAQLPYMEYQGDLQKSESDSRRYRLLKLTNGLVAMVINDTTVSKACATMAVNVGSLADPPELQGLAHFCEHLLFMVQYKSIFITSI